MNAGCSCASSFVVFMKCPYCNASDSKVIDSRTVREGKAIRRRRECVVCARRFTSYEVVEEFQPIVVKKDGRRELFQRSKVIDGILRACEKRPITMEQIDNFVLELEREIQDKGDREIQSSYVGEKVMAQLKLWDDVAYVRFASVYKQFGDVQEFMDQLLELLKEGRKKG